MSPAPVTVEAAVRLLRRLEWPITGMYSGICAVCGSPHHVGHAEDCELAAFLSAHAKAAANVGMAAPAPMGGEDLLLRAATVALLMAEQSPTTPVPTAPLLKAVMALEGVSQSQFVAPALRALIADALPGLKAALGLGHE